MKVGRKARKARKKVEIPKLDFDMDRIREIKERKKKIYKRWLKKRR